MFRLTRTDLITCPTWESRWVFFPWRIHEKDIMCNLIIRNPLQDQDKSSLKESVQCKNAYHLLPHSKARVWPLLLGLLKRGFVIIKLLVRYLKEGGDNFYSGYTTWLIPGLTPAAEEGRNLRHSWGQGNRVYPHMTKIQIMTLKCKVLTFIAEWTFTLHFEDPHKTVISFRMRLCQSTTVYYATNAPMCCSPGPREGQAEEWRWAS